MEINFKTLQDIYTLFSYKNVIFWVQAQNFLKNIHLSLTNLLLLNLFLGTKTSNLSYFSQHISTLSNNYTLYPYIFENIIVWCISFLPIITKTSILMQP